MNNESISKRLKKALMSLVEYPGVIIERKKDVPLFYLDKNDSNVMIRELNGKCERGRFLNNKFIKEIKKTYAKINEQR
jgi:hypothetical protein